jgi:membrane protease YdiL (CAAX protease family)
MLLLLLLFIGLSGFVQVSLDAENLQSQQLYLTGLIIPSLFSIVLLLRPIRTLLARLIPIDAESATHAVALVLTMLVVLNLATTLGQGLTNVSEQLESQPGLVNAVASPTVLWIQQLGMALLGVVGVGWLSRRTLAEALQRLAITPPSLRQVAAGVGLGLVLAAFNLGLQTLGTQLGVGVGSDVEQLSEQLFGPLTGSVAGILTIGLAAGIGEETLLRGALQPRFGLLLTSVIFSLLHSQYGFSLATAIIFVVGLALGVIRNRANTTTSMIVHAVHNIAFGVLGYLALQQS